MLLCNRLKPVFCQGVVSTADYVYSAYLATAFVLCATSWVQVAWQYVGALVVMVSRFVMVGITTSSMDKHTCCLRDFKHATSHQEQVLFFSR